MYLGVNCPKVPVNSIGMWKFNCHSHKFEKQTYCNASADGFPTEKRSTIFLQSGSDKVQRCLEVSGSRKSHDTQLLPCLRIQNTFR